MILNLEQRTPAWHDWRAGKDLLDGYRLTASDMAAVAGISPFTKASVLWEEKKGLRPPKAGNWAMQRGNDWEAPALEAFTRATNIPCYPVCTQHDIYSWLGASLDGLDEAGTTNVEVKVPGKATLELAKEGKLPAHYMVQVQIQMACSGATQTAYWAYDVDGLVGPPLTGYLVWVARDEYEITRLIAMGKAFRDSLIAGTPPGVGFDLEMRAHSVASFKRQITALEDALRPEMEELKALFLESGRNEILCGGLRLSKKNGAAGKVDWDRFIQQLAADHKFAVDPSMAERFRGATGAGSVTVALDTKKVPLLAKSEL